MILEASGSLNSNDSLERPKKVKNLDMFNSDKKLASEIFTSTDYLQLKTIHVEAPEECPDDITRFEDVEVEPHLQTIIKEIQDQGNTLDKYNKSLRFKQSLKGLKKKSSNSLADHSPDYITGQVLDKLYNM
jgi:hypothetical protein